MPKKMKPFRPAKSQQLQIFASSERSRRWEGPWAIGCAHPYGCPRSCRAGLSGPKIDAPGLLGQPCTPSGGSAHVITELTLRYLLTPNVQRGASKLEAAVRAARERLAAGADLDAVATDPP